MRFLKPQQHRPRHPTRVTRRSHIKATPMYKILKDQSVPHPPFESFLYKTQRYYWTSTITWEILHQTDLALPRPNTNFLKHSFNYSGAMLWNKFLTWQKQYNRFTNLKANLPLFLRLDRSDSLIYMCVYLKLILITFQNSHQHNYIAKLAILYTFLRN